MPKFCCSSDNYVSSIVEASNVQEAIVTHLTIILGESGLSRCPITLLVQTSVSSVDDPCLSWTGVSLVNFMTREVTVTDVSWNDPDLD